VSAFDANLFAVVSGVVKKMTAALAEDNIDALKALLAVL